eukprot:TRINITY_DN16109_c0_g9_i1.p1 TRINITY_DN16109_c0_g9~~TRINITY_DN16109_c0_g9_i1.p1  ORF type:complete len:208 (+),score=48.56 TRINITY_DN16109_c0_g9_i1:122-745(+)
MAGIAPPRAVEMKVVMVGDIAVGKTSVAARFIRNQYNEDNPSTIGASYMWKECLVKDQKMKFSVWDTAGQEQYHSLVPMYFRSAAAVVLVYDLSNDGSLEAARKWQRQIKENAPPDVIVALAGNKVDLPKSEIVVTDEKIDEIVEVVKADFSVKCSAKTSSGVFELFESIANLYLERQEQQSEANRDRANTFIPGQTPPPPRKTCKC